MHALPQEYRCHTCKKLLFKGVLVEADVEVACKACHTLNTFTKSTLNPLLCMIEHCPNRIHCPSVSHQQ